MRQLSSRTRIIPIGDLVPRDVIEASGLEGAQLLVAVETIDELEPKLYLADVIRGIGTIGCIENDGESLVYVEGGWAHESVAWQRGGWAEHWRSSESK